MGMGINPLPEIIRNSIFFDDRRFADQTVLPRRKSGNLATVL